MKVDLELLRPRSSLSLLGELPSLSWSCPVNEETIRELARKAGILNDWTRLNDCYVYIVGPLLGAVLAAWIYTSYIMDEPTEPK